jgi:inorganic triphosphatase YgiF
MVETELKLALPSADPSTLLQRLKRVAVLARRKSTQLHLHNVYFDTPDLALRLPPSTRAGAWPVQGCDQTDSSAEF